MSRPIQLIILLVSAFDMLIPDPQKKRKDSPYFGWPGDQGGLWYLLKERLLSEGKACIPPPLMCDTLIALEPRHLRIALLNELSTQVEACAHAWNRPGCGNLRSPLPLAIHLYGASTHLRRLVFEVVASWHRRTTTKSTRNLTLALLRERLFG